MSFDTPLPASQQPRSGDVLHSVLRVTTSSGVQVYKVGDIVKLDTKPIIYGKVMHFVKVSKKNDVDKVVVQRQPEEVSKDETILFLFYSFSCMQTFFVSLTLLGCHALPCLYHG